MSQTSTQQRIQCFKEWLEEFKKKPRLGRPQMSEAELLKVKYGYTTK